VEFFGNRLLFGSYNDHCVTASHGLHNRNEVAVTHHQNGIWKRPFEGSCQRFY
jgi:hypothetical protein